MCGNNVKQRTSVRKNNKHRLRGVKVLPLEGWMGCIEEDLRYGCVDSGKFPEIPPIVGRDGYYLHQRLCWFEYGGKAYARPEGVANFKYRLDLYDAKRYNTKQYEALCRLALDCPSLMTRKQRALMYTICDVMKMRDTFTQSQKFRIALDKKLSQEANEA